MKDQKDYRPQETADPPIRNGSNATTNRRGVESGNKRQKFGTSR